MVLNPYLTRVTSTSGVILTQKLPHLDFAGIVQIHLRKVLKHPLPLNSEQLGRRSLGHLHSFIYPWPTANVTDIFYELLSQKEVHKSRHQETKAGSPVDESVSWLLSPCRFASGSVSSRAWSMGLT